MPSSITKKLGVLAAQKKPFKFLLARLLALSGLSRHLSFERNGYRLRLFPSALSQEFWLYPESHLSDELLLGSLVKEGDTVIDAGANIGSMTLAASRSAGSSGRVHAIEAHPAIFGFLRENVRLNRADNVELYNCALGSENGEISFSDEKWDNENFVLDGNKDGGRRNSPSGATGAGSHADCRVEIRKLDDLGISAARIKLLKIDVEGYEKFVLEGAKSVLKKTDCVHFESYCRNYERYGYGFGEIHDILKASGFNIYRISGGKAEELGRDNSSQTCENLLAVRDESLLENYL